MIIIIAPTQPDDSYEERDENLNTIMTVKKKTLKKNRMRKRCFPFCAEKKSISTSFRNQLEAGMESFDRQNGSIEFYVDENENQTR